MKTLRLNAEQRKERDGYIEQATRINTEQVMAGKTVFQTIIVKAPKRETFAIASAVESEVDRLGYDVGSMQRNEPRAIAKKPCNISKWRNLGADIARIDGFVLCNDYREGRLAAIVILNG